jgi:hypothetical protein
MSRVCAIALAIVCAAAPARAQDLASRYLALAREYAAGHGTDAERGLAAWSRADIVGAANDTVRYLAHLFLGRIAERENRLPDALVEYEAVRSLGSGYQTPYAALSRVEEALGHGDRARELAMVGLQLEKADDDPWWDLRVGFDRESLIWLRAEARRP